MSFLAAITSVSIVIGTTNCCRLKKVVMYALFLAVPLTPEDPSSCAEQLFTSGLPHVLLKMKNKTYIIIMVVHRVPHRAAVCVRHSTI